MSSFPHPFKKIAASYRTMRAALPREVSVIAINEFKNNFRQEGYDTNGVLTKWKKRVKEDAGRALLVKSGRLKRGLVIAPTFEAARVVNDVPYAKIHNEGGNIKGTFSIRSYTTKRGKKVKSHTRKVNTTIPARPFMIDTYSLSNKIDKHIDKRLTALFNV